MLNIFFLKKLRMILIRVKVNGIMVKIVRSRALKNIVDEFLFEFQSEGVFTNK